MIIIGSEAIKYYFPDFPRKPKDLDIIVEKGEFINLLGEYSNYDKIERLENPILLKWHKSNSNYLIPDYLYTLKISHSFWNLENGSWLKHIANIQWLKEKGCKLNRELFNELFEYWEKIHGKRKASNLDMNAEDFFNNAIKFPFEHDFLHEILIKHPYFESQEKPTYTKILKEGAEVDVCMEKFSNLTEKEKFNVTFEEICCMAVERYPKSMYYKAQYERMLKKFIISHCKIDQGIWIIENHKKLMTEIPFDFITFFKKELNL